MIEYESSGGLCILRLNAPPLNTISLEMLEELRAAVARANGDDAVRAVVITGNERQFSAGADINLFREIETSEEAQRTSRLFQQAFQDVEDSQKPVAAAVAGKVLGGSLELAAACHVRVGTPDTRFSMPEVRLGFNPGAGGTQRLPRLIGPEKALEMMLSARSLGAEEALALGLVDRVSPPADLVATARELLDALSKPRRTSGLCGKVDDDASNTVAVEAAVERVKKLPPEIVAPGKIIDAVRTGLFESVAAGIERECRAFGECLDTPAARNRIYLFFATREMTKAPEFNDAQPGRVGRAGVVGMGSMGTGIAQALISGGVPVVVCDAEQAALDRGVEKITRSLQKRVEQGRLAPQDCEATLARLTPTTDRAGLAGAELVVESVFESVSVKRGVLAELENVCSPDAILATNTSTISLDVLADRLEPPDRLVGMHFFNPAHAMPLVEIIRRQSTAPDAVATTMNLARKIRKSPVLVNNREGFLVNRIFLPYLKEAFWLLEDGVDARAVDAAMVRFGFSMGPLTLSDMVGVDVLVDTDAVLDEAFPRHGRISVIARRLAEQGHLGQKTGAGVYRYQKGDHKPHDHEVARQIIAEVQEERGSPRGELSEETVTDRLVLRMVAEAFCVLEEGVAQRESDVDAAMVLGTGFPDFRGGVLKYARDAGLDSVVDRLDNLAETVGERFSPCRLLKEMKGA